ncbi:MAG: hypothetical protein ACXIVL_02815 [Oceanicaulis sp.]
MTQAAKRYTVWFLFWMMMYSAVLIGGTIAHNRLDLDGLAALAVAVAPVLPTLMALREFVIFLRAMDEVQARIQSEAILIAAGVVGFGSFAWGFVESRVEVPDVSLIWILPAMVAVWGLALPFVSRRYK